MFECLSVREGALAHLGRLAGLGFLATSGGGLLRGMLVLGMEVMLVRYVR